MAYGKDFKSQMARATEFLTHALATAHQTSRKGAVSFDVDRDRVIVKVDGTEITALGPKEWFMSDDEVQQKLDAAVLNHFGQGQPPLREPEV